jgi:hypothetical protein
LQYCKKPVVPLAKKGGNGDHSDMNRPMLRTFLTGLLFAPLLASAHGLGGFSIDKETDAHLVDISFDKPVLHANEPTVMLFQLWNKKPDGGWAGAGENAAAVRITRNGVDVFDTQMQMTKGGWLGMTYAFPAAGDYILETEFLHGTGSLLKDSSPLTVKGAVGWSANFPRVLLAITSLLALGFLWMLSARFSKQAAS